MPCLLEFEQTKCACSYVVNPLKDTKGVRSANVFFMDKESSKYP
jgi:hypothetical protein